MIRNYFKLVVRGFLKNRFYTILNVVGLAIGFASTLVIGIYVYQEFNYDKFFPDHERLYRLSAKNFALTSMPHLSFLEDRVPGITHSTVLLPANEATLEIDDSKIETTSCLYVSEEFFDVFPYRVLEGNPQTMINAGGSAVFTRAYAKKIFGRTDIVGEVVKLHNEFEDAPNELVVTGVLEDIPQNSHINFDFVVSIPPQVIKSYGYDANHTIFHGYFRLDSSIDPDHFISQAALAFAQQMLDNGYFTETPDAAALLNNDKYQAPLFTNISDIHLRSNLEFELSPPAYTGYLYILMMVAFFILVLATINYANLAMVLAIKRAKEIGVRKVLGSRKSILLSQFTLEAVFLNIIALLCSFAIVEAAIVAANTFTNIRLNFSLFTYPEFVLLSVFVAIGTGCLAGLYPGIQMSSYKPGEVLKGGNLMLFPGKNFRQILFVLQFTLAMVLSVFGWFVQRQIDFGLNKDLGFDHIGVININNANNQLGNGSKLFCQALKDFPEVHAVSLNHADLSALNSAYVRKFHNNSSQDWFKMHYKFIDEHYVDALTIHLKEGRSFDHLKLSDTSSVVINVQMAKKLGINDLLDHYIEWGQPARAYKVIGIVNNFHHKSLQHIISPTAFFYNGGEWGSIITVKLQNATANTITKINGAWKDYSDFPMIYTSLESQINEMYKAENQLSSIISIFTILAIIVTGLGIIGLSGYLAQNKTKEIGIRKVLGATVRHILVLLTSKFSLLVLVALLIAIPIAFWLTKEWLLNFSYQIPITIWPFIGVGAGCFLLTILATSFHFIKAAISNPIHALRME